MVRPNTSVSVHPAEDSSTSAPPPANSKSAVAPVPAVGEPAPPSPEFRLPRGKPTLIVFLRQCGDPFAEKTFRELAQFAADRVGQVVCVAVSQAASQTVTDRWVAEVGGAWDAEVVTDPGRELYARWGLGLNTSWQLWNPRALYATYALGRDEGIWSRWTTRRPSHEEAAAAPSGVAGTGAGDPSVSSGAAAAAPSSSSSSSLGNRWQMGGAFALDAAGVVRWAHVPRAAEDVVDFEPVLAELFRLPPRKKRSAASLPSPIAVPEGFRDHQDQGPPSRAFDI